MQLVKKLYIVAINIEHFSWLAYFSFWAFFDTFNNCIKFLKKNMLLTIKIYLVLGIYLICYNQMHNYF